MDAVHKRYKLKRRYRPTFKHAGLTKDTCPATRMANGTTHYLLYRWCIETGKPICIVEHDAEFVGEIPAAKPGVIQISSHVAGQMDQARDWLERLAARMTAEVEVASRLLAQWTEAPLDDEGFFARATASCTLRVAQERLAWCRATLDEFEARAG